MKQHARLLIIVFIFIGLISSVYAANEPNNPEESKIALTTQEMTIEEKRTIRKENLPILISKYEQKNMFTDMHQYMVLKYKEFKKKNIPPKPDRLIVETLEKSSKLFEKIRSFVGNNFKRQYDPVILEAKFKKYLWLKGICFAFLGIGDEHKIAVSYFFQPGNENIKREFMIDAVKYSYPEVKDIPKNAVWFEEMGKVMERIAYRAFNIEEYYPEEKK